MLYSCCRLYWYVVHLYIGCLFLLGLMLIHLYSIRNLMDNWMELHSHKMCFKNTHYSSSCTFSILEMDHHRLDNAKWFHTFAWLFWRLNAKTHKNKNGVRTRDLNNFRFPQQFFAFEWHSDLSEELLAWRLPLVRSQAEAHFNFPIVVAQFWWMNFTVSANAKWVSTNNAQASTNCSSCFLFWGINYGFQVMESAESPNIPFTTFRTRYLKGNPRNICI